MTIDAADVGRAAADLGLDPNPAALEVFAAHVARELAEFDDLVLSASAQGTEPLPEIVEAAPMRAMRVANEHPVSPVSDRFGAWVSHSDIAPTGSGVLGGRTVAFKDHVPVAGLPLTYGAAALDGHGSGSDAPVVGRVLGAGGRIVGKNVLSGVVRPGYSATAAPTNPRDPSCSAGGSSSGSAVAVAGGEVDISYGGDQGGSARVPAAYCGVVGFKPSFGQLTHADIYFTSDPELDHLAPIGRTVMDVAAAAEAVRGVDPRDSRQSASTLPDVDLTASLGAGVDGVRIGVLLESIDDPCTDLVRRGMRAVVDWLTASGARLSVVSVPAHRTAHLAARALTVAGSWRRRCWARQVACLSFPDDDPRWLFSRLWTEHPDRLAARTQLNLLVSACGGTDYPDRLRSAAISARSLLRADYDRVLSEVDLLLMPTTPIPPPGRAIERRLSGALVAGLSAELSGAGGGFASVTRNTQPFNLTGHPALAVPPACLPPTWFSVQIVGRIGADALVLQAGHSVSRSVDPTPHFGATVSC